ncbi:MAG: hypothetical protein MR316_00110 [Lachnospiraceae bacterium]|nr:hypothetical protein [Lachnospiraceae bacterium]
MFLKSHRVAMAGMITALTVLFLFLSGVLEYCSLACLAAAAFLTGRMAAKYKWTGGAAGLVAALFLGFLLMPNKFYLATYLAMAVYVLIWEALTPLWYEKHRGRLWIVKGVAYHGMLAVAISVYVALFGIGKMLSQLPFWTMMQRHAAALVAAVFLLLVGAEILWIAFDKAYRIFRYEWFRLENRVRSGGGHAL